MTNKLEISRELAEVLADPCAPYQHLMAAKERLRTLLAEPPIIKILHENGDLIAANATISQQAQMIEYLKGAQHQGEPVMKLEAERLLGRDGEYSVSFVKPGWLDECRRTGGEFLLYTTPPAPVATPKIEPDFSLVGIVHTPPVEYDEP